MIKVTLNPHSTPETFEFHKSIVTIGAASTADLDLSHIQSSLSASHLKIVEDKGRFLAINEANDPFATLNGLPFGKKVLYSLDRFQIGNIVLDFEGETSSSPNQSNTPSLPEPAPAVEASLEEEIPEQIPVLSAKVDWDSLERELLNLDKAKKRSSQPEEDQPQNISIKSPENIPHPISIEDSSISRKEAHAHLVSNPSPTSAPQRKGSSHFLGEFDDESEHWEKPAKTHDEATADNDGINPWKMWGWFFVAFLLISALCAFAFYRNMATKKVQEEAKAAETVADVAMALKYAQLHHIKPPKQNWSDPNFIRNSLANVIPSDSPILPNLDAQGRFINTPYLLRTYTNADFSHFLVIAQPAPSFLQWLVPKNALVVDSRAMELRKISDLKVLNRILVNSNMLDKSNENEISDLVKQGELIPLMALKSQHPGSMFTPPKALMMIRPGAENLIYNAPRYYQMGEGLMKQAVSLTDDHGNIHELSRLKHQAHLLAKMPNLILYSSQGISLAMQGQKALGILAPDVKFLTAYLTFNSKGAMFSSHLVMDGSNDPLNPDDPHTEISISSEHPSEGPQGVTSSQEIADGQAADDDGKWGLLIQQREEKLASLAEEIAILLQYHITHLDSTFDDHFKELTEKYLALDRELSAENINILKPIPSNTSSISDAISEPPPFFEKDFPFEGDPIFQDTSAGPFQNFD